MKYYLESKTVKKRILAKERRIRMERYFNDQMHEQILDMYYADLTKKRALNVADTLEDKKVAHGLHSPGAEDTFDPADEEKYFGVEAKCN